MITIESWIILHKKVGDIIYFDYIYYNEIKQRTLRKKKLERILK